MNKYTVKQFLADIEPITMGEIVNRLEERGFQRTVGGEDDYVTEGPQFDRICLLEGKRTLLVLLTAGIRDTTYMVDIDIAMPQDNSFYYFKRDSIVETVRSILSYAGL